MPYLLFVFLAVNYAEKTRVTRKWKHAVACGLFLALAILLRNEGLLLFGLFALWYFLEVRNPRIIAAFVIIPGLLSAWYFIEPALHGGSYFEYATFVSKFKEISNQLLNISTKEALYQWVIMLVAAPTLIVVLPGLWGLWENRRRARSDLFAWMFVAQAGFYFLLTLTSAWRPQLRYLMLQFVNLFPYAALIWLKIMRRYSFRYVLAAMLALMISMQSVAWWVGRNNRLPGGWLPLQVITSPQKIVDEWVRRNAFHQPPMKVVSIVPGPLAERWTLEHAFVINRLRSDQSSLNEFDVHVQPEILKGILPKQIENADVILIDSQAVFYSTVISSIKRLNPDVPVRRMHAHIDALLLSERSRTDLEPIFESSK